MRRFTDGRGAVWVADAREEDTPRHHGRWVLFFRPETPPGTELPLPEVRWQTRATAARTLHTMSIFELRRRLDIVRARSLLSGGASPDAGAALEAFRTRTPGDAA